MNLLVVFEEGEVRDLVCFFLEARFRVTLIESSTADQAIKLLSDENEAFDALVCDWALSGKKLVTFAIGKNLPVHFFCCSDEAALDPIAARRKEWTHVFPTATLIESLEALLPQTYKELKNEETTDPNEYSKVKPSLLLLARPTLLASVYVKLSDIKYVRIMKEGLPFEEHDLEYYCRKKKIDSLHLRRQKSKSVAMQIHQEILKRRSAHLGNVVKPKEPSVDSLEEKKKRLEYLKSRAKELEVERQRLLAAKMREDQDKQQSLAEAQAKELEAKRAAMIQAKAADMLEKKRKAELLAANKMNAEEEKKRLEAQRQAASAAFEKNVASELEAVQEMSNRLGFTKEVQEITKKSVMATVQSVRSAPRLSELLHSLQNNQEKYISAHSMLLAYVSCALATQMDWSSDTTYQKLTLAAFLHDISLKNHDLAAIQTLSDLMEKQKKFTQQEIKEYKEHPNTGAETARGFSEVPPDVDSIIGQHHERPDGSGFPRGLTHARIGPLAAVFIVAHELVCYLMKQSDPSKITADVLDKFLDMNAKLYSQGNFKKVLVNVPKLLT